ncbi:cytochrome C554 [candidate division LCP-89 bacterium B3_LCP]|uniref:Cytochrome C554 n=1 Tax=candidate division LCP-89 bacterium B3_LCP TaxID=2012998 RepID=A0A532USS8_UNCL8|nr:MAG: cytochrome C554 [candidate division LCP-89 bacterium B3_LCP]
MKRIISVVILCLAVSLSAASLSFAQHSYTGIKSCKMCHKGEKKGMIYEKWASSKHAQATEIIKAEGEGENELCLKCHSTGYGAGGYDPSAENREKFAGVGCEACHGPGKDYKESSIMKDHDAAIAAGLIVPDEKTCIGCHNDSYHEDSEFDYAERWLLIEHKVPEKTEESTE